MRLSYESAENALRLTLDGPEGAGAREVALPGYLDVGESGHLLGVELHAEEGIDLGRALARWVADPVAGRHVSFDRAAAYIELAAGTPTGQLRTAAARLRAELDASGGLVALWIPRRGAGYEITYPSGNQ
ncbi:MAG: DUF2283 domain-containing protein [Thermomicrobiaceae bacterium]|nr:DUF2283 domain-containing protein [Thermomicrobiaceae bacterium]